MSGPTTWLAYAAVHLEDRGAGTWLASVTFQSPPWPKHLPAHYEFLLEGIEGNLAQNKAEFAETLAAVLGDTLKDAMPALPGILPPTVN